MAIFLFIRNKLFYLEYEKERKQKQLIEDVGAFFHDFIPNSIILQIGAQVYNIASLDKRKAYTVMVENLVKITFEMFVIQGKSIYSIFLHVEHVIDEEKFCRWLFKCS